MVFVLGMTDSWAGSRFGIEMELEDEEAALISDPPLGFDGIAADGAINGAIEVLTLAPTSLPLVEATEGDAVPDCRDMLLVPAGGGLNVSW